MPFNRRGLASYELILVLIIASVLAGFFIMYIDQTAAIAKETSMRTGLHNLRKALILYQAINGKFPEDLKGLVEEKYTFGSGKDSLFGNKFLSVVSRDNAGHPVDPYGRRFYYDKERGVVRSLSEGYESW